MLSVPSIVLGPGCTKNGTDKNPCHGGAYTLIYGQMINKQTFRILAGVRRSGTGKRGQGRPLKKNGILRKDLKIRA